MLTSNPILFLVGYIIKKLINKKKMLMKLTNYQYELGWFILIPSIYTFIFRLLLFPSSDAIPRLIDDFG